MYRKDGARMSELDNYIVKCCGAAVKEGITTPTLASGKSYCDELKALGDPAVCTATG